MDENNAKKGSEAESAGNQRLPEAKQTAVGLYVTAKEAFEMWAAYRDSKEKLVHFVPYWTRAQIENEEVLSGRGMVFLDDPVEAFILHVQGSGRIRLRDGKIRRIQFAAKNGLPYRSNGFYASKRCKRTISFR